MQWEILVVVVLVIGICTAIIETRAKRIAHSNENVNGKIERRLVKATPEKSKVSRF